MSRVRVGDRVGTGSWAFHSRFPRSLNFLRGAELVSVVLPDIGAGPHAVVMDELPGVAAPVLAVGDCWLELAGQRFAFDVSDVYHSRPDWGIAEAARLSAGLGSLQEFLLRCAPDGSLARLTDGSPWDTTLSSFDKELAKRFLRGRDLLLGDDPAGGARLLHGAGRGLTPAGDDFLAGALHGWRLREAWWGEPLGPRVEAAYAECAAGGNPFAVTFLREARDGRVFERLERLVRALLAGAPEAVEDAAEGLFAVGATSGADLAAGLAAALAGVGKD